MGMLATFKWRIALSLSNVLIAIVLFRLGVNEARRYSFPHANLAPEYVPTAQRISYSMNLPPFVARNLTGNLLVRRYRVATGVWDRWVTSSRYHEGANYYVLVFLFWWWIGGQIDRRGNPRHVARPIDILGYSLGMLSSLALFYIAATAFADGWTTLRLAAGFLIPISAVIWGTAVLWFSGRGLMPLLKFRGGSALNPPAQGQ
jgi:hypothetical protein